VSRATCRRELRTSSSSLLETDGEHGSAAASDDWCAHVCASRVVGGLVVLMLRNCFICHKQANAVIPVRRLQRADNMLCTMCIKLVANLLVSPDQV
jgi:hypothetical protein